MANKDFGVSNLKISDGANITGVVTASSFSGSASGLTNVPAGNLVGTVSDSRLNEVSASKLTGTINNDRLPNDIIIGNNFSVIEKGEWYMPVGYARTMTAQVGQGITMTGGSVKTISETATRTTDAEIYDYCWDNYEAFDLDGDGIVSYNDTTMFLRYLFGNAYGGIGLIGDLSSVYSYNATRTTHEEIRRHLSKYSIISNSDVSYTNTETVLSGVNTTTNRDILDVGIDVTGPGIPSGTTVTAIGINSVTVSQPVTLTRTNATVTFGNGVLDIDGDGSLAAQLDGYTVVKVFGSLVSEPDSVTVEGFKNFNFSNSSNLNPDDGGGARFRSVGASVGVGMTTPSTSNLQRIELGSGVYLNGSSFGKIISIDSTNINQLSKLSTSNNWDISLGISTTVPNPDSSYCHPGQSGFISIAQTAGGGKTVGWGTYWDFADGIAPTLSTGSNDVNVIGYYVRSNTSIVADTITDIE